MLLRKISLTSFIVVAAVISVVGGSALAGSTPVNPPIILVKGLSLTLIDLLILFAALLFIKLIHFSYNLSRIELNLSVIFYPTHLPVWVSNLE